jgi:hypothetical protein
MAIFKGETVDRKRTVTFVLTDRADNDARITGHTFATGEIKIAAPGGSIGNADVSRIVEIGGGAYGLQLTDAQVLLAGAGVLEIDESLTAAVPQTLGFQIDDPDDFGADSSSGSGSSALLPAGTVTLASLRSLVRLRGDYLSSLTFDDDYLNLEIQAAWVELFELMDDVGEGWWDSQGTVSTTASVAYVAAPSTCKRVLGVDILEGGEYRELRQVATGARNRYGSSTGQPVAYRLSSRGIELFPTPAAVYTLRVTFSPICPALHESNGIELYGLHEYIVTAALLRLDQREERPLGERLAELERQRQRVVKAASKRKQQEPEYLNLRMGDGEDMDWWA